MKMPRARNHTAPVETEPERASASGVLLRSLVLAALSATAMLLTAGPAPGQEASPPAGGSAIDRVLQRRQELKLSSDQVNTLRSLQTELEKDTLRKRAELAAAIIDVDESQRQEAPDDGKRTASVRRVEALRSDLWLSMLAAADRARGVLTPAQRQLFASLEPTLTVQEPGLYDPGLRRQIEDALSERLKDQRVVEVDATQAIVARITDWAKTLAFVVGIPLAILAGVLGFLGVRTYSDFSTLVKKAQEDVKQLGESVLDKASNTERDLSAAHDRLGTAETELTAAHERLKETKQNIEQLLNDLEQKQSSIGTLADEVKQLLADAKTHLGEIEAHEKQASELVISMTQKRLTVTEKETLKQTQRKHPNKFRAGHMGALLWPNGSTIHFRFMDGSKIVQDRVKQAALEWTNYANIHFEFDDSPDAEVRISFKQPGSWSYRGTEALAVPKDGPNMNFGWLDERTPDEEYSRVVLKEFGHLLGLINEHQNPQAKIPWDKQRIYRDLTGPPNYWTTEAVDREFFEVYKKSDLPSYRPFDPDSIMTFQISAEWTGGKLVVGSNTKLSQSDKDLIAKLYPPDSNESKDESK